MADRIPPLVDEALAAALIADGMALAGMAAGASQSHCHPRRSMRRRGCVVKWQIWIESEMSGRVERRWSCRARVRVGTGAHGWVDAVHNLEHLEPTVVAMAARRALARAMRAARSTAPAESPYLPPSLREGAT